MNRALWYTACNKNQHNAHFLHSCLNLTVLSSTYFEHPSVHHQEDCTCSFTVFHRSLAEIAGSNPNAGMDVCLVSVVCCRVEVTATSWSLVQRSPTDCGVSKCDRGPTRDCWKRRFSCRSRCYCPILTIFGFVNLKKTSNIKCHPIPSSRSGVDECRRTDERKDDVTKERGAFAALWDAPKIWKFFSKIYYHNLFRWRQSRRDGAPCMR
jgi:hypothetical protein